MREDVRLYLEDAEPFKVVTSKTLYDAPPVQYIIDGILPTHSICGLTGAPGTGKSWLSLEMIRAIATGTKFLGHFETKQAPVLFVGSDASYLDYAQQWRRLTREAYDSYADVTDDEGRQLVENPFDSYVNFLIQSEFNLDDPAMIAKLIRTSQLVERPSYVEDVMGEDGWEQVEREGRHYGLIVYDVLSKLTRSEEKDNTARDVVFEHLRDIAEATGATLLVLHHPPLVSEYRTGEEWRGAGSQFGALDAHFHILRDGGRQDTIQFKVKKFRGITPKPFLFELDVFENDAEAHLSFMEATKDLSDQDKDLMNQLVAVLKARQNVPTTITDFAVGVLQDPTMTDAFKGDVTKVKSRIKNFFKRELLKADAPIVCIARGLGRAPSLYGLAPGQVVPK